MTTLFPTYHPAALKRDEFRSAPTFLKDIRKLVQRIAQGKPPQCVLVKENVNLASFEKFVDQVWRNEWSVDIETPGNILRSISFGGPFQRGYFYPTQIEYDALAFSFDLQVIPNNQWWPVFCRVFDRAKKIVVQNGAFDLPILSQWAIPVPWNRAWDTMLAGYVLNQDDYVGLSHLVSLYLDTWSWKHEREDPMKLLYYNGLDAGYTWLLAKAEHGELARTGQLQFFEKHLMPVLWQSIIPLNNRGMVVDLDRRKRMVEEFDTSLQKWLNDMREFFDGDPPLGKADGLSNKRVQKILYEDLGLKKQYHPSTRQVTADKTALKKLLSQDVTGTVELLYRRSELKERENHLNPPVQADGRVRSRYVLGGDEKHVEITKEGTSRAKDKGTRTGRLASREPNLQNVPESCRALYVPSHSHWWLVEGDSSQIEARLTQWFSGDMALKDAIDHEDVYLFTLLLIDRCTGLYGVHQDGWEALARRKAAGDKFVRAWRQESKRGFLGWSYRMGERQLELREGIPRKRARAVIEGLNRAFPKVVRFWAECEQTVHQKGYLVNPYGRRKYFTTMDLPKISNFLSQSTAADILFEGQKRMNVRTTDSALDHNPDLGFFLTTTHDSNLVEGPGPDRLRTFLKSAMEFPVAALDGLVIPCNVKVGKNWGEMK